jgi:GlcNAc-P-P-Und epimerase
LNIKYLITGGSGFIGTNLINQLIYHKKIKVDLLNIDIAKPKLSTHLMFWKYCNINNYNLLTKIIDSYQPTHIIHLAAEADVRFKSLNDFTTNINGVFNLCSAINDCDSVKRVIFTSTQYVHQFNGQPQKDDEYYPFTIYGESKAKGEQIVREFNLDKIWTIIRPTNIYGPFNDVYVKGLFKVIRKGYYFHPNINIIRSYGYVGTVVEQIIKIFDTKSNLVNCKTFYLGDEPIQLLRFVKAVHNYLYKEKLKIAPIWLFRIAAFIGELAKSMNYPFPMNKVRYINMVTANPVNMNETFKVLGKGSLCFDERINNTINWYLNESSQ